MSRLTRGGGARGIYRAGPSSNLPCLSTVRLYSRGVLYATQLNTSYTVCGTVCKGSCAFKPQGVGLHGRTVLKDLKGVNKGEIFGP